MFVTGGRLYWVTAEKSHVIQYYDFGTSRVVTLSSEVTSVNAPTALAIASDAIYCTDQSGAVHVFDKTAGTHRSVLRRNIDSVLALQVYDPLLQPVMENPCSVSRGNCSHICLPVSERDRVCVCAAGFTVDANDKTACRSADSFILYSLNWEIKGLSLIENGTSEVLGPVSRVQMATSLDFLARHDFIYWVDSDHGSVVRIRRDGTGRQVVAEGLDSVEGLAIDWIAGNMYWTNPKFDMIEVARLNSSFKVRCCRAKALSH